MPTDPRSALDAAQRELLSALVARGTTPVGFDAERIRLQARALLHKRARTAAAHHPWLAELLGPGYLPRFTTYAHDHPKPVGCSSHDDALAFEKFLQERGELPGRPHPRGPSWFRRR